MELEIMERAEAQAQGKNTYYTGRACRNGHVTYRYTQSGTCAGCINESTNAARRGEASPFTPMNGPREYLQQLIELRVRVYLDQAEMIREIAAAYCVGKFPLLTKEQVKIRATPTDAAGGTALFRVRVPLENAQAIRDTAQALLNARAIDVAAARARILATTTAQANAEAAGHIPAWRP